MKESIPQSSLPPRPNQVDYFQQLNASGLDVLNNRFNARIHQFYDSEPNMLKRLRKLRQVKTNIILLVKKNSVSRCRLHSTSSGYKR